MHWHDPGTTPRRQGTGRRRQGARYCSSQKWSLIIVSHRLTAATVVRSQRSACASIDCGFVAGNTFPLCTGGFLFFVFSPSTRWSITTLHAPTAVAQTKKITISPWSMTQINKGTCLQNPTLLPSAVLPFVCARCDDLWCYKKIWNTSQILYIHRKRP